MAGGGAGGADESDSLSGRCCIGAIEGLSAKKGQPLPVMETGRAAAGRDGPVDSSGAGRCEWSTIVLSLCAGVPAAPTR